MNSLEIINKRIKFLEDMIFMDLALIEDEDDLEGIAEKQKELNILQQIRTELEAWESVKSYLVDLGNVYVLAICNKDKEYLTLKKALEVKENVD